MPDVFDYLEAPQERDVFDEVSGDIFDTIAVLEPPKGTLARAQELGTSPYSEVGLINPAVAEAVTGNEPITPIPQIPQQEGVFKEAGAAVVNIASSAVNSLQTPMNIQMAPGAAVPGLSRVIGGIFGVEMARHLPEQVEQAIEAPTLQGKLEGWGGVGMTGLFAALGLKHAVGGKAKAAPGSLKEKLDPIIGEKAEVLETPLTDTVASTVSEPGTLKPEPILDSGTLPRETPANAAAPVSEVAPVTPEIVRAGDREILGPRDGSLTPDAVAPDVARPVRAIPDAATQQIPDSLPERTIALDEATVAIREQEKNYLKNDVPAGTTVRGKDGKRYQKTDEGWEVEEMDLDASGKPIPETAGFITSWKPGRNDGELAALSGAKVERWGWVAPDQSQIANRKSQIPSDESPQEIPPPPQAPLQTPRQETSPPQTTAEPLSPGPGAASRVAVGRQALRITPENKGGQWLVDNAKRLFTAEGDLPKETFQRWGQRHGEVKEQSRQTAYATRDLQEGLRREFGIGKGEELTQGFSKVPKEFVAQMNDALLGQTDINTLPESVREPLHRMREHIDSLSKTMLREGIIPEELQAKVEGNLGVYMTRSYRVFDDIKWPKQVAPEVKNRAADFVLKDLQRSNPSATPETARAVVESMLTDWSQQGTGALLKTGGKMGSKDLTSLIARKDIPQVIRQLMGEYKDPVINYTRSVAKMANLLGSSRFLNEARAQGMGKWLFEDGTQPASHSALIAAEASDVMAPLNGLRTTPEIAEAFRTFGKSEPVNNFWAKLYFRVNGIAKAGKTVGSIMTQVRNTVGQGYFWMMNGHFDVRPVGGALKAVAADIGLSNDVKWRDSYKRYLRLNVVDQSTKAGELRDVIKDAALNDMNVPGLDVGNRTLETARKIALSGPIRAYQLADDLGKIVGFENELARQKAINPTTDVATLEKVAAERIQNTYPTYSRVPEWVKQFRRQPVLGPFMTFAYESFRTAFHNLRYTVEDLGSSNPAQKKAGLQRLAGQTAVLAGGYVVGSMSRALLGLSVEEEDDARRFLPRWDKNAQLMFTSVGEGTADYVNLSFSNPYSYLTDPVMAVANGLRDDGEISTLLARSFGELVRPFASEDILANSLIDVSRNKTETGARVYNPQDTPENILAAKLGHVAEALEPGTLTRLRKKIVPALQGKETPYGTALKPGVEIGSELTGFKRQSLDYEQAVAFKARGFKREDTEAEGLFREVVLRRGTVSPEEVTEAYARSNAQRFGLWKTLYGDVKAAERRGVKLTAIKETLAGNGLSKADTEAIMNGHYTPYEPGDTVNDKLSSLNRTLPDEVTNEIARSKGLMLTGEYQ